MAYQLPIGLEQDGLLFLQKCQFRLTGKYSSYGKDPKGKAETSHISCKAIPNSSTGVKKVPIAGQYNSKMA